MPPFTADPNAADTLYLGTTKIYQTVDAANTWTPISNDKRVASEIGSRHNGHCAIARGCTKSLDARSVSQSGRHDAARFRHPYFSGHCQ